LRVDVYDPATNTWTRTTDMPEGITHAGTTVVGTDVYFAGAYLGRQDGSIPYQFWSSHVWKFDTRTATWSALPDLPAARGSGTLVAVGRTLHFVGGSDSRRVESPTHWTFDLDGPGPWTTAAPIPVSRSHMASLFVGGKLYVMGGEVGTDDRNAFSTVSIWDPTTGGWTTGADMPRPRSHMSAGTVVLAGHIVMMGGLGLNAVPTSEVSVYDPAANSWTDVTPLPTIRHSGAAGVIGGRLIYANGPDRLVYLGTPTSTFP
jgi:N-acetylneuraminic acid mutarotase